MFVSSRPLALILSCLVVTWAGFAPEATAYEYDEERPLAGYHKTGGFFLQSKDGKFKLQLAGGIQARYTYHAVAGFGDSDGAGQGTDDASTLSLPLAQLTVHGHLISSRLQYRFKVDFAHGSVGLEEWLLDYQIKRKYLHVRAGQWRLPPLRENMMFTENLSLADRSHFGPSFNVGKSAYDLGIALHNAYGTTPAFEYVVGLFTGTDRTMTGMHAPTSPDGGSVSDSSTRFKPMVVARIAYNYGGIDGYTDADIKGGGVRFSLGAGTALALNYDKTGEGAFMANVDYLLKVKGFSTSGAFFARMDQGPEGMTLTALGASFQASYLIAKRWQPVVRYELFMPEDDSGSIHGVTAGLSAYISKHRHVKWQLDASALLKELSDNDYMVRTQVQLMF